jgi:hypothetical protein
MIAPTFQPAATRAWRNGNIAESGAGAKRNDVGDSMLRLTPPTSTTFVISIIIAIIAVAGQYVHQISNFVPINMFWLAVIAYLVLFFGNLIRGI